MFPAVSLTCLPQWHGQRLDRVLVAWSEHLPPSSPYHGWSRQRWLRAVRNQVVRLQDRKAVKGSTIIHGGECIHILPPDSCAPELKVTAIDGAHVLYEDEWLVVLNKPAPWVMHGGAGVVGETLADKIGVTWPEIPDVSGQHRPGLVHRLDRGTSGVVVLGKTALAQQRLSAQFAQRRVEKVYVACVQGQPQSGLVRLVTPYGRHPTLRKCFTGRFPSHRQAITSFRTLGSQKGASWLQIRLETGRTHQIRVHLSELGHGLLGDRLYGHSQAAAAALGYQAPRQALHALSLVFEHPGHLKWCGFVAPLPQELLGLWRSIMGDCQPEQFGRWTG